jgi:hypothetical protein
MQISRKNNLDGVRNGFLIKQDGAQMGLADTAGSIPFAHLSGVSCTGRCRARLSFETKCQWPIPGGQL